MSRYRVTMGDERALVEVAVRGKTLQCSVGDAHFSLEILEAQPPCYTIRTTDGRILTAQIRATSGAAFVASDGWSWTGSISEFYGQAEESAAAGAHGDIKAPMPGRIVAIPASPGMTVKKGDPIVVIEAMKMQNALTAPLAGNIQSIHVKIGDAVESGQLLAQIIST